MGDTTGPVLMDDVLIERWVDGESELLYDATIDRLVGAIRESVVEEKLKQVCSDYQTKLARLAETEAERDQLRRELVDTLDVAIARGVSLDYSDDDYRALYVEMTGTEWCDDE